MRRLNRRQRVLLLLTFPAAVALGALVPVLMDRPAPVYHGPAPAVAPTVIPPYPTLSQLL